MFNAQLLFGWLFDYDDDYEFENKNVTSEFK